MKKILIFSFILWFCIINFFSFQDFYLNAVWNYFFSHGDFLSANPYYLKSNSKESILNRANTLYKEKKYLESNEKYLSIFTPEKNEFYFKLNHNIGNNYYKLSLDNKEKEKEYLEQSVTYYTNALDIRYDEETKKNLEFVMNKLKEIKEKQEKEQKKEQNSDQTGSGTQSNQNTGTGSNSENSQSWSGATNENTNQNTGSGNTQTQTGSISKEENKTGSGSEKSQSGSTASPSNKTEEKWNSPEIEKQLKAYEEQLKEEQKQNQSEVWKVYQPQNSQDPFSQFDNFFNTPSFDNSLLNNTDNKKDW